MMKTTSIIILVICATIIVNNSCAPIVRYSKTSVTIDLTEFEKEGLFVTTGDLFRKYSSVAIVSVDCYHGYSPSISVSDDEKKSDDHIYYTPSRSRNIRVCTLEDIFPDIIDIAKDKGANGIIKLEFLNITRTIENVVQHGYRVTGLIVKIEN